MKMQKIVDHLPQIFGSGGSILGLITFGKVIEVLVFAAVGAIVGLIIKEIWCWCKRKLKIGSEKEHKS